MILNVSIKHVDSVVGIVDGALKEVIRDLQKLKDAICNIKNCQWPGEPKVIGAKLRQENNLNKQGDVRHQ